MVNVARSASNRILVRLNTLAEKFINEDKSLKNLEARLQECIDILENYRMECEKLGSLHPETPFKEAYSIYESAYIYYMILFKLLTERVPQSHEYADAKIERRCQPLLEVYSTLKKSLLQDTMIDNVETFLIKYSNEDPSMKIISTQKVEGGHNLPSGPFLTVPQLQTILSDQKISVLLIDVRKRYEFEFSHINSVAVLPLDPVSYTHLDVYKRQMMNSTVSMNAKEIAVTKARLESLTTALESRSL